MSPCFACRLPARLCPCRRGSALRRSGHHTRTFLEREAISPLSDSIAPPAIRPTSRGLWTDWSSELDPRALDLGRRGGREGGTGRLAGIARRASGARRDDGLGLRASIAPVSPSPSDGRRALPGWR